MVQTPKPPGDSHTQDLVWAAFLAALWLFGGLFLALATLISGGHPAGLGGVLGWPFTAVSQLVGGTSPREAWTWVGASGLVHPAFFWPAVIAQAAILLLVGAPLAYNLIRGGLPPMFGSAIRRSSVWAPLWEIKPLLVSAVENAKVILGFSYGRLLATEAGASILVFGPTQSGKSSALCIPSILEWDGPVLAISVKRDLVDGTAGWRQRKGHIYVFDPSRATDLPITTWSPLDGCEVFEYAMKVAAWMTQGMDKGKGGGDTDWQHWADAANRLLSSAMYAAACLGEPITEVRRWINDGSGQSLERALKRVPNIDGRAMESYVSIRERPERERQTCYSTTQRMLRIFLEDAVAESTSTSEFKPHEFLTQDNATLYLVAPIQDQKRLTPLFTGLVMSVINEAVRMAQKNREGRLSKSLLCVLDECANTAPIEELPSYLSTGFSQGIVLMVIFQDRAQIIERYGQQGADTVCNNARAKLFLPGISDPNTLEFSSKLVGKTEEKSYSYSPDNKRSYGYQQRELMPADVQRQIRTGTALLIYHTFSPILIKLRSWYKEPELLRRGKIPFIPGATYVGGGTGKEIRAPGRTFKKLFGM